MNPLVLIVLDGVGYTELTLDHLGWLGGDKWDETYAYFDNAWDVVLQALRDSL